MTGIGRKIDKGLALLSFKLSQRLRPMEVPHEPHFDPEFTAYFRERLPAARRYVEFGSGGSTLLADRLGIAGESVESDSLFARAVQKRLSAGSRMRVSHVDIGLTGLWGVPVMATPTPARVARWRRYVTQPFAAGPAPDLVLVDGRFRRACALEAVRQGQLHATPVTVMIDDYFREERGHYHAIEAVLGPPRRIGRSAIFDSADARRPVSVADVDEAARDFQ